jgi:hypothetical protein
MQFARALISQRTFGLFALYLGVWCEQSHTSGHVSISLGDCLGLELLGHMVFFFFFSVNCQLFSKVPDHFYSSHEGSSFSKSLSTLVPV